MHILSESLRNKVVSSVMMNKKVIVTYQDRLVSDEYFMIYSDTEGRLEMPLGEFKSGELVIVDSNDYK